MTARAMTLSWFFAIAGTVMLILGLACFQQTGTPTHDTDLSPKPVTFIGSSLLEFAISAEQTAAGVLYDGRQHRMLTNPATALKQITLHLKSLKDSSADTVFLEIQPLLYCIARNRRPECSKEYFLEYRNATIQLLENAARALKPGQTENDQLLKTPLSSRDFHIPPATVNRYSFKIVPVSRLAGLKQVIRHLASNGKQIILVKTPRSRWEHQKLGPDLIEKLAAQTLAVSEHLGAPVFQPALYWPNTYFVDFAHMNKQGQARFMAELRHWWINRQ